MSSVPRLRTNVLANASGRIISMGLAIVFTPVYINYLGIEGYGLIGFYITLQASISFLEMGLSRACNRELAIYSGRGKSACKAMIDTLRSLEVIYWVVAILLGVVLSSASSWISSEWLDSTQYDESGLENIMVLMAWVISFRWPVGLYAGALMGMQRQLQMNAIQVLSSVLNWGGSALILWLIRPDIQLFFQWQIIVAICTVITFLVCAWRALPMKITEASFSVAIIKKIIPFSVAVGGNAILGMILRQADKLILSSMLPLKEFGYYALASTIANIASIMASSVSNAIFPRFSNLLGAGSELTSIKHLYHLSSQFVSVMIVPFSLAIIFYAPEVLYVYTGSIEVMVNTSTVLSVLVAAKMIHASLAIPYSLQLASGWVRLSLYMNMITVAAFLPAVYLLSDKYGAIGAASSWLIVVLCNLLIGIPIMHQRLLRGEAKYWFKETLIVPVIAVGFLLYLVSWNINTNQERLVQGMILLSVGFASIILSMVVLKDVRGWIKAHIIGKIN